MPMAINIPKPEKIAKGYSAKTAAGRSKMRSSGKMPKTPIDVKTNSPEI